MQKGYKARLYPTPSQKTLLLKNIGACRFVYNHFLARKKDAYRKDGTSLSYNRTAAMLTGLKADPDYPWLNECDSMALQESLRNLDRAYENFFKGNARFPRFHSKRGRQSYRTRNQGGGIRIRGDRIRIPKVGFVRFRGMKGFTGRILNATVSLSPGGKFYISLCVEEADIILPNQGGRVGIDVGLSEFYTDSNGNCVANVRAYRTTTGTAL